MNMENQAKSASSKNPVPFNRPPIAPKEAEYLAQSMAPGATRCGDGPFTHACQKLLEQQLGARKALLTTSCTDALELAGLLLDLKPGDEVVLPGFTFVSTANAFVLRGATPIFADIRPDTLNLDERTLDSLIGPRTKAVVVVHYGGIACAMDDIVAICKKRGVALIEDNAHGLYGRWRGRVLGTIGQLGTQSFHETKNLSCGEGGALLVNDPALEQRAEIIREKGTNRALFFRGQVDKYTWVDIGSSFLPSELLAAVLQAQLEHAAVIQAKRAQVWKRYHDGLAGWAKQQSVQRPVVPEGCDPAWHLYHLVLPSLDARQGLIAHLNARGIKAVFHYLPLHASPMGLRLGGKAGQCPVTEAVSDRLIRLPFFSDLSADDQDRVIGAVREFSI